MKALLGVFLACARSNTQYVKHDLDPEAESHVTLPSPKPTSSKALNHRLHSSPFLGLPYRILNMNPKKELLWSPYCESWPLSLAFVCSGHDSRVQVKPGLYEQKALCNASETRFPFSCWAQSRLGSRNPEQLHPESLLACFARFKACWDRGFGLFRYTETLLGSRFQSVGFTVILKTMTVIILRLTVRPSPPPPPASRPR